MVLLLLLPFAGIAQETVVKISPGLFDERGLFYISQAKGWHFKLGNDTSWAKNNIDMSGWENLAPADMSVKYADKNGRVEGWFRLKIKIDHTITDRSLGFKTGGWGAVDIYVDGQPIVSNGNTGSNSQPYREGHLTGNLGMPVYFKPGTEHTVAMHFVDYVSPVPPLSLKFEGDGSSGVILLTKPGYNSLYFQARIKDRMFDAIWIAVGAVLSLLFWLLFIQNPLEKNLKLIAPGATFLTAGAFFAAISVNIDSSYAGWIFFNVLSNFLSNLGIATAMLILVSVFKRKTTNALKLFLSVYLLFHLTQWLFTCRI